MSPRPRSGPRAGRVGAGGAASFQHWSPRLQRHFANKSPAGLRAKRAGRCGDPFPVPDSPTCRFHDSVLLGNLATSKLLEAGGPRARGGLGFSAAAGLALDEGRPLLPSPQELKFRPRRESGVPDTGISGFPKGTEERRSRAPYFQWVLATEGSGRTAGGPGGRARRPGRRGWSGFPRESLCAQAGTEAAPQGAHRACPRKGARAAARRQAGPPGLRAESRRKRLRALLASVHGPAETPRSGSEAQGTRPSPAAAAAGALCWSRALDRFPRPGAGADRLAGARTLLGAHQSAGAHSQRRGGAPVIVRGLR